jgi:formylglycine-generating enzyme required for sulfatase activity
MPYFLIFASVFLFHVGFTQENVERIPVGHENSTSRTDRKIDFKNTYFQGLKYIDTSGSMVQYAQKINLSENDSTYFFEFDFSTKQTPFYISDHEVTNGEYHAFVKWVFDSIAREKIFTGIEENLKSEWGTYVDYNTGNKDKTGRFYRLNWDKKLVYDDPKIALLIRDMYHSTKERFYKRNEIDVRLIQFNYLDRKGKLGKIPVYPDTLCWSNELPPFRVSEMERLYFWHPAYKDYPVVGLTYAQAEAYCYWRTMMYHFEAGKHSKAKYDKNLIFRLPSNDEWSRAAYTYNTEKNNRGTWNYFVLTAQQNGFKNDSKGNYEANYGTSTLISGIIQKHFEDDGALYTCNVRSYAPNFNDLYCMYGNVAEWTYSQPELGDFFTDYVNLSELDGLLSVNSSKQVYITDPYTDSTYLVAHESAKHKELIEKRLNFYKVLPDDNFEQVIQKLYAIYSISDEFSSKINELNFPITNELSKDSLSVQKYRITFNSGTEISDIPFSTDNLIKLYSIRTGQYFYDIRDNYHDFIVQELKSAFQVFQQNVHSLNRANNSGYLDYPDQAPYENGRLVKGGSWIDEPHYLILNNSQVFHRDFASCRIGFRIAADANGCELNNSDKKRIRKQREIFAAAKNFTKARKLKR